MPLNLNPNSGGDFVPYLKYNAKSGRWYGRFDAQGGGHTQDIEVPMPRLVFDFANIKTGWILFGQTGAPQTRWDPDLTTEAQRPEGDKWKRGFQVKVVGNDPIQAAAGQTLGVRELMSTAGSIIKPILGMYEQWETDRPNPSDLPFYKCTGVEAVTGQNGVNYEPVFGFISWVPRSKVPVLDGGEPVMDGPPVQDEPPQNAPVYEDDDVPF